MSTRGVSTPGAKKKVLCLEPIICRVSTRALSLQEGGVSVPLAKREAKVS